MGHLAKLGLGNRHPRELLAETEGTVHRVILAEMEMAPAAAEVAV
jgi:hypothetical protein